VRHTDTEVGDFNVEQTIVYSNSTKTFSNTFPKVKETCRSTKGEGGWANEESASRRNFKRGTWRKDNFSKTNFLLEKKSFSKIFFSPFSKIHDYFFSEKGEL